jgi:hypothetical protein
LLNSVPHPEDCISSSQAVRFILKFGSITVSPICTAEVNPGKVISSKGHSIGIEASYIEVSSILSIVQFYVSFTSKLNTCLAIVIYFKKK